MPVCGGELPGTDRQVNRVRVFSDLLCLCRSVPVVATRAELTDYMCISGKRFGPEFIAGRIVRDVTGTAGT